MIIRLFEQSDRPRVEEILLENGMNTSLASRQYVAIINDEIVGTGGIIEMGQWSHENCGWLASVAVAKSHKRMGIGKAIVNENIEHAAFCKYEAVWLETYFWNSRFYEKLGFVGVPPKDVPRTIMPWRVNKRTRLMCHKLVSNNRSVSFFGGMVLAS